MIVRVEIENYASSSAFSYLDHRYRVLGILHTACPYSYPIPKGLVLHSKIRILLELNDAFSMMLFVNYVH